MFCYDIQSQLGSVAPFKMRFHNAHLSSSTSFLILSRSAFAARSARIISAGVGSSSSDVGLSSLTNKSQNMSNLDIPSAFYHSALGYFTNMS